jgi:hypothetical protein
MKMSLAIIDSPPLPNLSPDIRQTQSLAICDSPFKLTDHQKQQGKKYLGFSRIRFSSPELKTSSSDLTAYLGTRFLRFCCVLSVNSACLHILVECGGTWFLFLGRR